MVRLDKGAELRGLEALGEFWGLGVGVWRCGLQYSWLERLKALLCRGSIGGFVPKGRYSGAFAARRSHYVCRGS